MNIFKTIMLGLLLAGLTACESDPTLQSYIVESDGKDGFVSTSIPKAFLGIDTSKMSAESKEAYESIKKVNVLAYPIATGSTAAYERESAALNDILKSDKYTTLMTHSSDGIKARFLYEGEKDSIDEIIVFGTSDELGMGVARFIGDGMNLSQLMNMMKELKEMDVDPMAFKGILTDLGMKPQNDTILDETALEQKVEKTVASELED